MAHLVHYNGKTVSMDYVSDPKKQFKLACMRVHDNGAAVGYVLTPKSELFQVNQGKRMAILLKGETKDSILPLFQPVTEKETI